MLTIFFSIMPSKNSNDQLKFFPVDDGVTHINIYSRGKTELGRMLSHFYPVSVEHPEYGYFANMECFWHYLATGCQHDELKRLNAFQAKQQSKLVPKVYRSDFMEQIKIANRFKILQHPEILEKFKESTLPFEHYYLFGNSGALHRPPDTQQLIDVFESLRVELRG